MTTPADELRTAANDLRHEPQWVRLGHDALFGSLANWLEETAEEYEAAVMAARHVWGSEGNQKAQAWLSTGHGRVGKHALAVARQINAQS